MKNREIENDDYGDDVFANDDVFKQRFRRLEGDELVEHKRRIARRRSQTSLGVDSLSASDSRDNSAIS